MAVTLNVPFTFYIHRMTSRFYGQQNIPSSVSVLLVVISELKYGLSLKTIQVYVSEIRHN